MKTVMMLLVILLMLVGCSQFSTHPHVMPRVIEITGEGFEQAYVLKTRGEPALVLRDNSEYDSRIEFWFYPEQSVVVVLIIEGEHVRAHTYCYEEGNPNESHDR